jgi:hypothetical protein
MRVNVWLPDELNATIKRELPDVNVSAVLQRSLAALLECRHDELACRECASPIDRRQLIDNALSAFYADLHWRLRDLVERGGTAEGAARIAKDVACRHRVSCAPNMPLPRPSREQRHRQRVLEFDRSTAVDIDAAEHIA